MKFAEAEINLVHRRVRDSRAHVVRQQTIVDLLRAVGLSTQSAEMALADFKAVQHEHEACLSRLKIKYDDTAIPNPPLSWKSWS